MSDPGAQLERPDPQLLQELIRLGAATIYEASGHVGAMDGAIKPVCPNLRLAGPALTVRCHPGDNLMIHLAVALARPGDVLVVDAAGHTEGGYWGEILTVAAQARGVAGLVIDGSVRDVEAVVSRGFPVFARAISIRATAKRSRGAVGVPICAGGVLVRPGDLVVGDRDGVVAVERASAGAVLEAGLRRADQERRIMQRLEAGELTIDILGLRGVLAELGFSAERMGGE